MNRFIATKFYKNEYIKIKVFYPDRRIKTFYEIPKNNLVAIKGIKKAFQIKEEFIIYEGKEPVIYYNYESPLPLNFKLDEGQILLIDEITSDKLYAGLETNLITQLFLKFFKEEKISLSAIITIISTVITLGAIAFLYLRLNDFINYIVPILEG